MSSKNPSLLFIGSSQGHMKALQSSIESLFPGIDLRMAPTPLEGIETAWAQDPDMILLDLAVASSDQYALCRRIASDERLQCIPMIILTDRIGARNSHKEALGAGIEGFLVEPFEVAELATMVLTMPKVKLANARRAFETEAVLERRNKELALLYEAGTQLSQTLELEEIYASIHLFIRQNLPCDGLYVSSFSDTDNLIRCQYGWHQGERQDVSQFPPLPLGLEGKGTQTMVIRTGKPIYLPDYEAQRRTSRTAYYVNDEGEVVDKDIPDEAERTRSALLVPLKTRDKVVGVIQVFSNQLAAYEESDCRLLESLAFHASAAISNAMLYQQARVEIAERVRAEQERDIVEEQLRQAQKMESVGRLAGGVAHDFNNMLQVILGHADIALEMLSASSPIYEDLEQIRDAGQRSADLTHQLLAFARKQTILPEVLDLNKVVGDMLKMLQRLIGENVQLIWKPGAELWPTKFDPSQLNQILANLSVNARDAIAGAGNLTIETANAAIGTADGQNHLDVLPGEYVLLRVSDTGQGMDKETLSHVFEPFFTTKDVGEGTGLGLATVFGIVKQSEGFINVESELGQGTTFEIYLPRVPSVVETKAGSVPAQSERARGIETILLVEDEKALLKLATVILEQLGYTVLAAQAPGAALDLAKQHVGPIHLLITDIVMPEMNGRDLRDKIEAQRPGMKALFMSGYTANIIAQDEESEHAVHFLQKPFSSHALSAKVREALDQA